MTIEAVDLGYLGGWAADPREGSVSWGLMVVMVCSRAVHVELMLASTKCHERGLKEHVVCKRH